MSKQNDLEEFDLKTGYGYRQQFTINVGKVVDDKKVMSDLGSVRPELKAALLETHSPILHFFEEAASKSSPEQPLQGSDTKILLNMIDGLFSEIPDYKRTKNALANPAKSILGHYDYLYGALSRRETQGNISAALEDCFKEQFIKDVVERNCIQVIDQNGKEISANIRQEIRAEIVKEKPTTVDQDTSPEYIKLFEEKLQAKTGMSPAQLKYFQAHYNQRSLTGAVTAFGVEDKDGNRSAMPDGSDPSLILIVNKAKDGKLSLQKLLVETELCNIIMETATKNPYGKASVEVDLSSLAKNKLEDREISCLPTEQIETKLSLKVYYIPQTNAKEYQLPECLEHLASGYSAPSTPTRDRVNSVIDDVRSCTNSIKSQLTYSALLSVSGLKSIIQDIKKNGDLFGDTDSERSFSPISPSSSSRSRSSTGSDMSLASISDDTPSPRNTPSVALFKSKQQRSK